MNSLMCTMHSIREMFDAKLQEFDAEANAHMVWLDEIQQEAFRMFSSDFNAEPELMPKTPSQRKTTRRKRVSVGRVDNHGKRRFSRGTRSNLRRSSARVVLTLGPITEDVQASGSGVPPDEETERPKCNTHHHKQQQEVTREAVPNNHAVKKEVVSEPREVEVELASSTPQSQLPASSASLLPVATVVVSAAEHHSADLLAAAGSPGHVASKTVPTAVQESTSLMVPRHSSARRVSVRCSLSGLRRSMTQESLRRASRRSILKKKAALNSSSVEVGLEAKGDDAEEQMDGVLTEEPLETVDVAEPVAKVVEEQDVRRFTRSMAQTSTPTGPPGPSSVTESPHMPGSDDNEKKSLATISSLSTKNLCPSTKDLVSPQKKPSPPIKSQSVIRPNMKSFLHTVAKNQMLMSTPGSLGRNAVKSFIKHTTPLRVDLKERERLRLEALKKKQEQEMERREKIAEEKKRKLEEMKRKRDERLRRVVEARVKEEQKEEEKKKKIEQKLAHMEEKNEKMRVERMAEEKAKKKVASKRQEELELRRKQQEEEAARKKMQQEEERRQRELQAKQRAEEEERARKLAEARRAQELQKERELELQREREKERLCQQQAAERERIEREKAEAQRREQELAAREKENKEAEERRLKQTLLKTPVGKCAILNVTVEASPQSYEITPKGGNKAVVNSNPDDYGMDQNSDDSTDDESAPRKPIPSWAEGRQLQQALLQQYFNPPDVDTYFGDIEEPHLEKIFYKSKPRYFKRTSSAVWNSPPRSGAIGL